MSEIATIIVPLFGLVGLGWVAGRYLAIPEGGTAGLNLFVFYFAMPALFFQLVSETPVASLANWSFVVTTTFSTYCAFAIAFSFGALINRGNIPEATIQGLVGSYANASAAAPALVLTAFGTAAAAPMALVFSFDSAMLFTLVPLMMALGGSEKTSGRALLTAIARRIALQPTIIATVLGLLAALVGFRAPGPVDGLLTLLGRAAAPAALFVLGVTLAQKPFGRVPLDLPVLVAVKLALHPLIVYLLLSWIGGFDPVWVGTAVLIAALPPAANVVVIARRYDTYAANASMGVLVGTIASVVTLTAVVWMLLDDIRAAGAV
jgi:predicted permease